MSASIRVLRHGLLLFLLLAALPPLRASAQITPPVRDTAVADTPADSIPAAARPLVQFPAFGAGGVASFAAGEWVWQRDALLREAPVSLAELLERIPAVSTFRAGMFVQPEAASAFGVAAGRVEVEIDGYPLDPLSASTLDLSQIPLAQLREVRVQRRLGLLRIRLLTEQPLANQPYTRIEAGVGVPDANLFRGLFLVPYAVLGPLSLGIERIDTDGTGADEPANIFIGWGKWSWTNGRRGVQLELLRTTLRREQGSPWPVERLRQDIIVRARNQFTPGLVAEAYAARVSLEETVPLDGDTLAIDRAAVQAGVRAGFSSSVGSVSATFRYRDAPLLPATEVIIEGDGGVGPVRVGGEFGMASWEGDSGSTRYSSLRAAVGPLLNATAFAELTRGDRAAPLWTDSSTLRSSRNGWRAGLSLTLGRATGSLAAIGIEQSQALPFGLPFDTAGVPGRTEPASGLEAHGRFQIVPGWLAIESWIVDWQKAPGWIYLPLRFWRTALEVHAVPLPSGNLEILARAEGTQRSAMLAFEPSAAAEETLRAVPSYTTFSGYLQIRIIDVRAFLRWEDVLGADIESLPDRRHNGPRIFYGVKWNLWN